MHCLFWTVLHCLCCQHCTFGIDRKGKRSALVDHHMKNKQHRSLMAEMDKQLRKVTIVSGMAQRLTNKVAIVTGVLCSPPCMLKHQWARRSTWSE